MRPGALRRHRRPVAQEDHAGDLRPREPRPAAARLQPGRLRPPRLGRPGLRPDRPRLGEGLRPHRVPRGGLAAARRGLPVRARRLRRRRRLRPAAPHHRGARPGPRAPTATTRSTSRSRPGFFGTVVGQLKEHGLADGGGRTRGAGSSSRSRSATTSSRRGAQRHPGRRLPVRLDLPDRPLPRQGDGAEHPGDALRQHHVRADLERQLRRPRADHHGRGRRHRRPGRLLRRHRRRARRDPEPPAPADVAGRDGGADVVRRREPADREAEGALAASCSPAGST